MHAVPPGLYLSTDLRHSRAVVAGLDICTPWVQHVLMRARAQVHELRKRTTQLPDDYWVVLVGDMITEEALPTYMAMLNTLDGVRDETGASPTPWGRCATCFALRLFIRWVLQRC